MEWSRANDDVRQVAAEFGAAPPEGYEFWCECGCRQRLKLTLQKFDALRRDEQPLLIEGHSERYRRGLMQERATAAKVPSRSPRQQSVRLRERIAHQARRLRRRQ